MSKVLEMRHVRASDAHAAAMLDVLETVLRHRRGVSPIEMIAILSHAIGRIMACIPDARYDQIAEMVSSNIDYGNTDAVADGMGEVRGHA